MEKPTDQTKLRQWAKQTQMELRDLKRRITHLEVVPIMKEQPETDYVKFQPIRYPPKWLPELQEQRARLCQVQYWTPVSDGKLTSLETGTVRTGSVYLAVHREDVLAGKEIPDYGEWLRGIAGVQDRD